MESLPRRDAAAVDGTVGVSPVRHLHNHTAGGSHGYGWQRNGASGFDRSSSSTGKNVVGQRRRRTAAGEIYGIRCAILKGDFDLVMQKILVLFI